MKTKLHFSSFYSLFFLIVLFFIPQHTRAQEIIEYKGDTLVTITPDNLKTINCIIADFEYNNKQIRLYKEIIFQDSLLIINKDSVIRATNQIMETKEKYYQDIAVQLQNEIKKEKKKRTLWTSILGGVAAIFGILLIAK